MSQRIDISTNMVWKSDDGKRELSVFVNYANDVNVLYQCPGAEDQLLELDEHAWHALYEMMGEVKP
jgi:hypothetical protein